MRPTIPAIQTKYKGYHFRSRLDARWAVFFDACGVRWEYEKEGYDLSDYSEEIGDFQLGRYLPDFYLPELKTWVEIKGGLPDNHWKLTLPEVQIWSVVAITRARAGWVFFGVPDIDTPASASCHGVDNYPDSPNRDYGTVLDMLHPFAVSDADFDAAKSARFEFGGR